MTAWFTHVAIRTYYSSQRLLALAGAAGDRQDHPSLVWGIVGRVDHVSAVFPARFAAGLSLLPRPGAVSEAARTNDGAWRSSVGQRPGAADIPERGLETHGAERPDLANPWVAGGDGRSAILRALDHRSAAPGLVRPAPPEGDAVPPLRPLQCRLHVRAAELSGIVRAGVHHPPAGRNMVHWLRGVPPAVRIHGVSVGQRARGRGGSRN